MIDANGAYEVRRDWNRQSVLLVAGLTGVAAVIALVPSVIAPVVLRALLALMLLAAAGLVVWTSSRQRTAFRAGPDGVFLQTVAAPRRARTSSVTVPWDEIERIVLFEQPIPGPGNRAMPYVGLVRVFGLDPLVELGRSATFLAAASGQSPDLAALSTQINLWTLDLDRLAEAVDAFAPGTPIDDRLTPGRYRLRVVGGDRKAMPRPPAGPLAKYWLWAWRIAAPVAAVYCVAAPLPHIGGAWSAHLGHGRPGTLTMTQASCATGGKGCHVSGDFVSDDGSIRVPHVRYADPGITTPRATMRAYYTGDAGYVYPPGGGQDWLKMSAVLGIGIGLTVGWTATTGRTVTRRVRRARS